MNDPDPPSSSAKRRRVFGRRRAPVDDSDSVDINSEATHDWWAGRETLDHLVAPKARGARARRDEAEAKTAEAAEAKAAEAAADDARTGARAAPATDRPAPSAHIPNDPAPDPGPSSSGASSWRPEDVFDWDEAESATDGSGPTPWDILGLTSAASWQEITRRHKDLAKTHHPDRVSLADAPSKERAAERMSEINAAFSELRRIYRLTGSL